MLRDHDEALFAYIHGSILYSDNPKGIDVAVFLNPKEYNKLSCKGEQTIGFAILLEREIDQH